MIRYVSNLAGVERLADVRAELPEPRCRTCGRHQIAGELRDLRMDPRPLDRDGRPKDLCMCVCGSCTDCHNRGERQRPACPPMTRR